MYPRVQRTFQGSLEEVEERFYTRSQSIVVDVKKCVGCGTCERACPVGAIVTPEPERARVVTEDLIAEVPDPRACSYCGTCAYTCPFGAITLKKNGIALSMEELPLRKKGVLPDLERRAVHCEKAGLDAKVYVEGTITADWSKCISCLSCVNVCPTGAFSMIPKEAREKGKPFVQLDAEKCISCGACVSACSKKVMEVKISDVKTTGPVKEFFWNPLVERLKKI